MAVVRPATQPAGTPRGPGWRLVDRLNDPPYLTDVAPDGSATVTLPVVPDGRIQVVERIVIGSDSTTRPEVRVHLGTPDPVDVVDGTDRGRFDVAEYPMGLVVPAALSLLLVWSGADAGSRVWARVQASTYAYGG